jgi:hypothetical protein
MKRYVHRTLLVIRGMVGSFLGGLNPALTTIAIPISLVGEGFYFI